ncbi:MAG: preprotein translocase subunit TatC, partial [Planctomycetes bacterium]|nr:preprotein translocase subunit TatC [Planctomycetota bacterium]
MLIWFRRLTPASYLVRQLPSVRLSIAAHCSPSLVLRERTAMAKITYPNDDHFESTKMSFGEHLEELRVALFRAVFGLVVGVLIGLAVADYVVDWIKSPLTRAMVAHAVAKNVTLLEKAYGEEFSPAVRDFVKQHRVKFETVYFETDEWRRITKAVQD